MIDLELDNYFTENLNNMEPRRFVYAYTLAVAPYKKLHSIGIGKLQKWDQFSSQEQKDILAKYLDLCLSKISNQYIYETTQKGNQHVHGIVLCTEEEITFAQKFLWETFGYSNNPMSRVFCITKTIIDSKFWIKYMQKEQGILSYF